MPTFGSWLAEQRQQRRENMGSLAQEAGVDVSTLSRIENEKNDPTLETVIKICDALEVSVAEMLVAVVGEAFIAQLDKPDGVPARQMDTLTLNDIDQFYRHTAQQSRSGIAILVRMLQQVQQAEQNPLLPPQLDNPDVALAFLLPLMWENPMLAAELAYPSDFIGKRVYDTYLNGGVLTYTEVGLYTRHVRKSQKRTLANIQNETQRSPSMVTQLEGGATSRIKIGSLLDLDKAIGQGEIVGMFVEATRFNALSRETIVIEGLPISTARLGLTLITICRWLQVQHGDDTRWLTQFREQIRA